MNASVPSGVGQAHDTLPQLSCGLGWRVGKKSLHPVFPILQVALGSGRFLDELAQDHDVLPVHPAFDVVGIVGDQRNAPHRCAALGCESSALDHKILDQLYARPAALAKRRCCRGAARWQRRRCARFAPMPARPVPDRRRQACRGPRPRFPAHPAAAMRSPARRVFRTRSPRSGSANAARQRPIRRRRRRRRWGWGNFSSTSRWLCCRKARTAGGRGRRKGSEKRRDDT